MQAVSKAVLAANAPRGAAGNLYNSTSQNRNFILFESCAAQTFCRHGVRARGGRVQSHWGLLVAGGVSRKDFSALGEPVKGESPPFEMMLQGCGQGLGARRAPTLRSSEQELPRGLKSSITVLQQKGREEVPGCKE